MQQRLANLCRKFYASYYELDRETCDKLSQCLRDLATHIYSTPRHTRSYSWEVSDEDELNQMTTIIGAFQVLCPTINITSTVGKRSSSVSITWTGDFIVPNQFCTKMKTEQKSIPFTIQLRGRAVSSPLPTERKCNKSVVAPTKTKPEPRPSWSGRLRKQQ